MLPRQNHCLRVCLETLKLGYKLFLGGTSHDLFFDIFHPSFLILKQSFNAYTIEIAQSTFMASQYIFY